MNLLRIALVSSNSKIRAEIRRGDDRHWDKVEESHEQILLQMLSTFLEGLQEFGFSTT